MALFHRLPTHFVFGVLQSGLTTGIATLIASLEPVMRGNLLQWLGSWAASWTLMLPLVLMAAPHLQRLARALTGASQATR